MGGIVVAVDAVFGTCAPHRVFWPFTAGTCRNHSLLFLSPESVVRLAFSFEFLFFLRFSEDCTVDGVSRLLAHPISIANGRIVLDVSISKTDQKRRGSIHQCNAIPGNLLYPIGALAAYRSSRAYFPSEPALMCLDGHPLTAEKLNSLISE